MASLNKVLLIGNLGADVELRYLPNGDAVANLRLATTETWKDKDGNKKEATEWHRVTLFRRQAEVAGQYLKKGSAIYIEGKIKTRKWQDKDGKDQYTTEIHADEMKMLGKSEGGGNSNNGGNAGGSTGGGQQRGGGNQRPAQQQQPAGRNDFDDPDLDIPF